MAFGKIPQMTPEEQLILRCLRSLITKEPLDVPSPLDWRQIFQFAETNRVTPIVNAALPDGAVPDDIDKQFEESARRSRMRAAVMLDEFRRIHESFTKIGITIIPFKGIAISQLLYPSPSMRHYDDLDILVRSEAGSDALAALINLGYVQHPNAPRPEWHHLPPYIHQKRGTLVEIHFDLIRRSKPGWEIEGIWERSENAMLGPCKTRLLSAEDTLIASVLHARHNLYHRLCGFIDFALQVWEKQPSNNGEFKRMVGDAGAEFALNYQAEMAARLLGLELWSFGHVAGARYWIADRIGGWNSLAAKRSSLKQGPLPRSLEMLLMDSFGDAISLGRSLLAPPPSLFDAETTEEVPTSHYIRRLGRRLIRLIGQLRRLLQGD